MICAGVPKTFTKTRADKHTVVGIRHQILSSSLEGYKLWTNSQAVCEAGDIILQKPGVYDLGEGRSACEATEGCSHFTLSTVSGTDGLPDRLRNTLWLCRGEPKIVHHFG